MWAEPERLIKYNTKVFTGCNFRKGLVIYVQIRANIASTNLEIHEMFDVYVSDER